MVKPKPAVRTGVTPVDEDHNVVQLVGADAGYRPRPCGGCPWRVDQTGLFPAKAFVVSANTSYDASDAIFGCHESDQSYPLTCAGFLLRNSVHNLAIRMRLSRGTVDKSKVSDGGHELHPSYRAMAIANGVDSDDPSLDRCRADDE